MKDNQQVKPVINAEAGTVTFEVRGRESIVLEMAKLHPAIIARAAMVGMAQVRVVDAAAVPAADDEGNIIPEAERLDMKHARMLALVEHYHTGTDVWTRQGTGNGGGGKSITIEAIARVKGIAYEDAKVMVDEYATKKGMDVKKALAHLRTGAQVGAAIIAIRAERVPVGKVDADAALAEMGQ